MAIGFHEGWLGRFPRRIGAILCTLLMALNGGCPGIPGGSTSPDNGGNGQDPPDGPVVVTAEMLTPITGFGLSALEEPVTFFYSVDPLATEVRGFRVPVADGSLNSAPIGDPVITDVNLKAGVEQVLFFDPGEAGVGFYRVGIEFTLNGVPGEAESAAVVHVEGSPDPVFHQPETVRTQIAQGEVVSIIFDVRDPEGDAQWRLFYLRSTDNRTVPAAQLGTELATGVGNAGSYTLTTDNLTAGEYQLGLSATDSGTTVAGTSDQARIVTIPNELDSSPIIEVTEVHVPLPPTIEITAPGSTNVSISSGGSFTILFTGTVNEPGATGLIEVFYDLDNNVGNGFTSIAIDLPVTESSVAFPTDVAAGSYYIGATISDGINSSVTDYAAGKLIVTPAP